jgi:class 3 adenylate cyclase
MKIEAALRRAELLKGFAPKEVAALIKSLDPQPIDLHDNELLCHPNQKRGQKDALLIMTKGKVRIEGLDGQFVAWGDVGTVLSELELVDIKRKRQTAVVVTNGPAKVLRIPYAAIQHLAPGLKALLMQNIAGIITSKLHESRTARIALQETIEHDLKLLRQFVPESGLSANTGVVTPKYEDIRAVMYFSDVARFSTIAESLSARETAKLIREVLNVQVKAISKAKGDAKGEIDKFVGDAVMAWWILRPDKEEVARSTCSQAMVAAMESAAAVHAMKEPKGEKTLEIRIGLHIGHAHVGNYGSKKRSQFTLIGHDVNVAARLEQARYANPPNPALGSIRVSEEFRERLSPEQQQVLPYSDKLEVKPNTPPVNIWYSETEHKFD